MTTQKESKTTLRVRKASSSANASKTKVRRKPRRKRSGGKRLLPFLKVPAWKVWLGAVLVAVAYILFFYYFFVDPFSFRWKALYGDEGYPSGYDVHGIDISRYQGNIDW